MGFKLENKYRVLFANASIFTMKRVLSDELLNWFLRKAGTPNSSKLGMANGSFE